MSGKCFATSELVAQDRPQPSNKFACPRAPESELGGYPLADAPTGTPAESRLMIAEGACSALAALGVELRQRSPYP